MKLDKRLTGILYYLVLEEMGRSRKKPIEYNEDLVKLEVVLSKEL